MSTLLHLTDSARHAALALALDIRDQLARLCCLYVNDDVFALPLSDRWQAIDGVPGVEMVALAPAEWPADADPAADYHLLRGAGGLCSPGRLRVGAAIRLEVLQGEQLYYQESKPYYRLYGPGDVFTCAAGEAHQWRTLEPFRNRVSFTPALMPRP